VDLIRGHHPRLNYIFWFMQPYAQRIGGKKMKKRFRLAWILVLAMTITACSPKAPEPAQPGPETPAAEGSTATISVQVESSWREYYEAAVARVMEKNPGATINLIETGSFDHLEVLDATDVTNPDVADVFAIPADRIYGLSNNEALAPLDVKMMAENIGGFSDYDAGLGGNLRVDGEYLAFPMNIETLVTFVNTANAASKGIDISGPVELTELEYTDMLLPAFDAWFGVSFANAGGIELLGHDAQGNLFSDFTKEFSELNEQQKAVFTALYDYWKQHYTNGTPMWDAEAAWGYMDTEFSTGGQTALRIEGPWSTGSLSALAGNGADLEVIPINQITVKGYPLAHWKGGWGLAINSRNEGDEDKMALGMAMIEEIVNPEFAVDFFKATGKILENVSVDQYMDSDLSETDKKVISAVLESYEAAPARPLFTEWGSVWDTWKNGLLSWSANNPQTVEDAYSAMKASFDAMMANY
jgi:arabinogalactan oligomer/maltooligosaccharide transport system substrate-binding protein